jgi:NAD(P)H-flavin reductase
MGDQPTNFKVQGTRKETDKHCLISLGGENSWDFIPGQVAVLGIEGMGESYFAVASAPEDKGAMEFLVQAKEGVPQALCDAKQGDTVQAKGPMGKGFPIDNYKGRDLLLAAVGSAVAPLRGVLRSIMARRSDFGKIAIVYGVRQPSDFAFQSEVNDWQNTDINVVQVVSRPDGTDWSGKTGHVQDYFKDIMAGMSNPVALTCGMKEMQEQSREALTGLGISADDVLTNF